MSDNKIELEVMKARGWAEVGQTVILNQGLLEVRRKGTLLLAHQALIGIAERIPKTSLLRCPAEWVNGEGTIVEESLLVYGLAQDMIRAGYVQNFWVAPFLDRGGIFPLLVIDPSHGDEVVAMGNLDPFQA